MAEPSTTSVTLTSLAVGFASVFPGIDGNALIGAFAGAALLVVSSKDMNLATRCVYLVVSMIAGYLGAPDMVNLTPIHSTGAAAFLVAALAITAILQMIDRLKTVDLFAIFKKGE